MRLPLTRQILSTTAMIGFALSLQACGSQQVAAGDLKGEGIIMTAVYRGESETAQNHTLRTGVNVTVARRSTPPVFTAAKDETKHSAAPKMEEAAALSTHAPLKEAAVTSDLTVSATPEQTQVAAAQSVVFKPAAAPKAKAASKDDAMEFASTDSVSDNELSTTRGGFAASMDPTNLNLLQATSVGNAASGVVTGLNLISNDALNNTQGVVSLIQNSGNNVVIQSATIVNLTMQP